MLSFLFVFCSIIIANKDYIKYFDKKVKEILWEKDCAANPVEINYDNNDKT
jgi:hypothetical protein